MMTIGTMEKTDDVVLGKTHFRIPGNDELIAFSSDAIEKDQRHREALMAMSAEILRQVNQGPAEVISN